MNIKYLTPDEIAHLDPSLNIRNLLNMLPRSEADEYFAPRPPHWECVDPNEVFTLLEDGLATFENKHQSYAEHVRSHHSKLGSQGGKFSISRLLDICKGYYKPDFTGDVPQALKIGRDLLISMCKEIISKFGYPQISPPVLARTFGAIPSGQSKGTFAAESLEVNKISLQRFLPTTPGQRRMRNKDRGIFMDATANVRAQEGYLTAARNWLKHHLPQYFGSWLRPDFHVQPALTRAIDRRSWFLAWDYKSMDVNFTKRIAMELIYPLYEVLFPEIKLQIGCHFEQNFEQPIFFGDFLLEGTHSLLSGAGITNDFETLYTIMLVLGVLASLHATGSERAIVALGDDMALAVKSEQMAKKIFETATDVTTQVGMEFSLEKCAITQSEVIYCRRAYYPQGVRTPDGMLLGAYPSTLVWNNILQPENPVMEANSLSLVADLQRLDNLYGSPDWHYSCQCFSRFHPYDQLRSITSSEVALLSDVDLRDWWFRLYGERWNPQTSRSLLTILAIQPKKRKSI